MTGVPANSGVVELLADEFRPGGWVVLLDRIQQSYVSLDDPAYLEFPYVQVLAGIVDALPPGALDVVHVGGGGATLARWIDAVRPDSVQVVFESHAEMLAVVSARLPMAAGSGVDFRLGDGRSGVAGLPAASADVVVVDAFSGGRVPAELGTSEFFGELSRVLRPSGMLLMNTTGAAGSVYLRRLVAAIAGCLPEILMYGITDGTGNVEIAAAAAGGLPMAAVLAPDGPMGAPVAVAGSALDQFIDGELPLSDAFPMRSPVPPDQTWRVGTD